MPIVTDSERQSNISAVLIPIQSFNRAPRPLPIRFQHRQSLARLLNRRRNHQIALDSNIANLNQF